MFRASLSLRELARGNAPTHRYKIVIHADKRPANEHVRRYNGPSCSEVAALIPGNEDGMIGKRDILVRKRGQADSNGNEVLDKVSISHRSYDLLTYVMLFPNSTDGWHPELQFAAGERQMKLTPRCSTAGACSEKGRFSTVLSAVGSSSTIWWIRSAKMGAERLSYLLQNQQSPRAENYTALRELLGDSGGPNDESEAVRSRRWLCFLPLTLVGSGYMRREDA